jgi:hypothetical protein
MYTDDEYAKAKAWWALEDSILDILPDCYGDITEENK